MSHLLPRYIVLRTVLEGKWKQRIEALISQQRRFEFSRSTLLFCFSLFFFLLHGHSDSNIDQAAKSIHSIVYLTTVADVSDLRLAGI